MHVLKKPGKKSAKVWDILVLRLITIINFCNNWISLTTKTYANTYSMYGIYPLLKSINVINHQSSLCTIYQLVAPKATPLELYLKFRVGVLSFIYASFILLVIYNWREMSNLIFDKHIQCWGVCFTSFISIAISIGMGYSLGAIMKVQTVTTKMKMYLIIVKL